MLFQLSTTMWSDFPNTLEEKQRSVDGGRQQSLARLGRPSMFVHRHLYRAAQRALCIVRNTHSSSLTIDSASLIVVSPLFCSWQTPTLLPGRSPGVFRPPLISAPPFLLSSLCRLFSWLNYSWPFIVPNGQCTVDTEGFISLEPCVFVCGLYNYVWVGGWDNGAVGGRKPWQPAESLRTER